MRLSHYWYLCVDHYYDEESIKVIIELIHSQTKDNIKQTIADILEVIGASCSICNTDKGKNDEHMMLIRTRLFTDTISNRLRYDQAIPINNTGDTINDLIDMLSAICELSLKENENNDVYNRLSSFVTNIKKHISL